MKNSKILISFLLVLLIAISASAVSAADDAADIVAADEDADVVEATIDVAGDDDVAIQNAINNASAGDTINLGANKEYNINATVNVDKAITITGDNVTLNGEGQSKSGNGGALYDGFINIGKEGSNATITGLTFVNVDANKEYTHDNTLKGYGVQLANGATGVVVDNCKFYDFANGVYISSAPANIIQNCWFTGVSTLINNIPGGPKDRGSYAVSIMRSKGNQVINNTFYGPLCDGVSIAGGSGNTVVKDNLFEGNAYGIYFGGASTAGSVITGNTFKKVGSFSASYVDKETNQTVWDNFTDLPVISVQKASDNFEIKDNTFYAETGNVLIGANEANTAHGYPSDIGNIKVTDNTVLAGSNDTVMQTVVLFNIISETGVLSPVGPIAVVNNTLNGAKAAAYWSYDWGKDIYGDINIPAADPAKTYFEIVSVGNGKISAILKDVNGKALASEEIAYSIEGVAGNITTDENGAFTIENASGEVIIDFAGSAKLGPATTDITVEAPIIPPVPELIGTTLSLSGIDVFAGETGYIITATLLDVNQTPLANEEIIVVDVNQEGQPLFLGATDANGTIAFNVSTASAAQYTIGAFFLGNTNYTPSLDFNTVNIKLNPTELAAPSKSYKVKKSKKLAVTLTSNGKAVEGKEVSVKVNGKIYKGTTNAKGQAIVKVKISKKGTYKYKAKFAGDDVYKAVSAKGKIKVKA
jgi:parallel beta-helix repeat protein